MTRRAGVADASAAVEPPGLMPAIGSAESTESPPSLTVVPDGVGGAPVLAPEGIGASEELMLASAAGIDDGAAAAATVEEAIMVDDAAGADEGIVDAIGSIVDEGVASVEVEDGSAKSCWTGTGGA